MQPTIAGLGQNWKHNIRPMCSPEVGLTMLSLMTCIVLNECSKSECFKTCTACVRNIHKLIFHLYVPTCWINAPNVQWQILPLLSHLTTHNYWVLYHYSKRSHANHFSIYLLHLYSNFSLCHLDTDLHRKLDGRPFTQQKLSQYMF